MKLKTYLFSFIFFLLFSCKAYHSGSNGQSLPNPPFNRELLLQAARAGDLDKIKEALNKGTDINYQDASNRDSALLLAILYDEKDSHKKVIEFLREKEAKDDLPNRVEITAKDIQDGKKKGKFLRTVKAEDGRFFLLPEGCVSSSEYINGDKETKSLGKGSKGKAFLVYKISDWSQWAPKFPNAALSNSVYANHDADLQEFAKEDRDVILSMRYGFGNPVEVEVGHTPASTVADVIGEIPYAMKTAITGGTLKAAIEMRYFAQPVSNSEEGRLTKQMKDEFRLLFIRLSEGRKIYPDLNPDNIMWKYTDPSNTKLGGQWVIIDAKPPVSDEVESFAASWVGNINSFKDKFPIADPAAWSSQFKSVYDGWGTITRLFGKAKYLPTVQDEDYSETKKFFTEVVTFDLREANETFEEDDDDFKFTKLHRSQKILAWTKTEEFNLLINEDIETLKTARNKIRKFIVKQVEANDEKAIDFFLFYFAEADLDDFGFVKENSTDPDTAKVAALKKLKKTKLKEIIEAPKNRNLSLEDVLKAEHNRYRKALVMVPEADITNLGLAEDIKNEALNMRKQLLMLP